MLDPATLNFDESISYIENLQNQVNGKTGYAFSMFSASGLSALEAALFGKGVATTMRVYCDVVFPFAILAAQAFGAKIIPVDVCDSTLTMCHKSLDEAAKSGGKGIVIATATFGCAPDTAALKKVCQKHGLAYIEDHAQSFGTVFERRAHSETVCTSFQSGKFLQCGQGGAVLCENEAEATQVGRYLSLGWYPRKDNAGNVDFDGSWQKRISGCRSARMAEIVACLLTRNLNRLDDPTKKREHAYLTLEIVNILQQRYPDCVVQQFRSGSVETRWRVVIIAPCGNRTSEIFCDLQAYGSRAYLLPPKAALDWPGFQIEGNVPVTRSTSSRLICIPTASIVDCKHEITSVNR